MGGTGGISGILVAVRPVSRVDHGDEDGQWRWRGDMRGRRTVMAMGLGAKYFRVDRGTPTAAAVMWWVWGARRVERKVNLEESATEEGDATEDAENEAPEADDGEMRGGEALKKQRAHLETPVAEPRQKTLKQRVTARPL